MLRPDWLIELEVAALAPNPTTGLHFRIIVVLGRAAPVLARARAFRLFRFLVQLFGDLVRERPPLSASRLLVARCASSARVPRVVSRSDSSRHLVRTASRCRCNVKPHPRIRLTANSPVAKD